MNTNEAAEVLIKYKTDKPFLSSKVKEALEIAIKQLNMGELVTIEVTSIEELAAKSTK